MKGPSFEGYEVSPSFCAKHYMEVFLKKYLNWRKICKKS